MLVTGAGRSWEPFVLGPWLTVRQGLESPAESEDGALEEKTIWPPVGSARADWEAPNLTLLKRFHILLTGCS